MVRATLLSLLLIALLAPGAGAATRCTWRDIPKAYAVDEPVHRTLTGVLALLRRPPGPEDDDALDMRFAGDFHKVSPSTMRLAASAGGTRMWVMGATVGLDRMHARCRRLLRPAARRREARWYRRQKARPLRLAYLTDGPTGGGAGFLGNAADLLAGRMWHVESASDDVSYDGPVPPTVVFGLAPDAVASVVVTFGREGGGEHRFEGPVTVNAWAAELPEGVGPRPLRIEWRDAAGATTRSFHRPPTWQH